MPLIVMCGRPGSGKTTRALELKAYFEAEHKLEVILLNEEILGIDRNYSYSNPVREKEMRGLFRSHVEKNLTNKNVVILDTVNYIKGLRYELYCLARSAKSTNCVVYCETPVPISREWNKKKPVSQQYSDEIFEDVTLRMEEPNSRNRWDAPLFVVPTELQTPIKDITQAVIFDEKKSKDPVSTKADILKSGNFLHDLDKTLQRIIERVMERQNEQVLLNGGLDRMFFKVKFEEVANKELTLKRAVPVGQLKQFKTDFVHMNKHSPLTNIEQAAGAFVDYMQSYESDY